MKDLYIIILFFTLNADCCLAQSTINLNSLKWVDGIEETIPVREFTETDDGLMVTYYFNKISLIPDNLFDGAYAIHIDGFGNNMTEEEPLFPMRLDRYAINYLGDYSITMLDSSYVEFPLELSPARSDQIESREKYEERPVKPIRMGRGFYPYHSIEYEGKDLLKNFPTVYIKIKPVEYCHETKTVRCYTKISFLISSNSKDRVAVNQTNINYINNYVDNTIFSNQDRSYSTIVNRDYLIITSNQLLPAVQLFADWKKIQGFNVSIESCDNWSVQNIKSAISSFYDTNHSQYILLFGDETNVPPSQYYMYEDYYPGDLHYLFFNNSLHNNDISMGRIPVSNLNEAQVVLNKIYQYERSPEQDSLYYKNVLASSYFQQGNIPGTASLNYVESAEEVRTYLKSFNKDVHRVYYTEQNVFPLYYSTNNPVPDSLRRPNFNWDGDSADINNIINNGSFLVYHRDHGLEQRWFNPKYDTNDISNLINESKLPIVFSIACLTGRYVYPEESFVERFLKQEEGGCVGMIAATGQMKTEESNYLLKGLIDVIWPNPGIFPNLKNRSTTPIYMLGDILNCGFSRAHTYSNQNLNRTSFHCFCDPCLQIFTEKPISFGNVTITKLNNQITVNTNDQEAFISFYDKSTESISVYNTTSVTENCNPNETFVCISNPNRIPYIDAPYQNLYIQNDTISGIKTYDSNHVIIGSYVDIESPFGPVLFSGGNITINGDLVEIRGEVSIETGTELTIDTN